MFNVIKIANIKNWELDVLGVPFGSPSNRDAHGEYFDARTNLYDGHAPLPPVLYYHGFDPDGSPTGQPEIIGRTTRIWRTADGVWYRVVLDQASALARRVWDAAQRGAAFASSGTMSHIRRVAKDGHIRNWLVSELSLMDVDGDKRRPANRYAVALVAAKARYVAAGIEYQEDLMSNEIQDALTEAENTIRQDERAKREIDPADAVRAALETAIPAIKQQVQAEMAQQPDVRELARIEAEKFLKAREAELARKKQEQEAFDNAVAAQVAQQMERMGLSQQVVLNRRLPLGAPVAMQYAATRPYDNMTAVELASMVVLLDSAQHSGNSRRGVSASARKALAVRLQNHENEPDADKPAIKSALKAALPHFSELGLVRDGVLKANEVMQNDAAGAYGGDWAAEAWSSMLWDIVRVQVQLWDDIPKTEIPQGYESITIPVATSNVIFYTTPQATGIDGTSKLVIPTDITSQVGTNKKTVNLGKLTATVLYTGELEEDSIIPFATLVRNMMVTAAYETVEHVLLDGDARLVTNGGTLNINTSTSSAGLTTRAAYLAFDGIRKYALQANSGIYSRAASALTANDFLDTVKLMGVNGIDRSAVLFVVDHNTYYVIQKIGEVKTRDVFEQSTLQNGALSQVFGYRVLLSAQMCKAGGGLSQSNGYIHDTPANNTTGQILAVRPDQWYAGYKRLVRVEAMRLPRSDTTEITISMRLGLVSRSDTSAAAAITTNVPLA